MATGSPCACSSCARSFQQVFRGSRERERARASSPRGARASPGQHAPPLRLPRASPPRVAERSLSRTAEQILPSALCARWRRARQTRRPRRASSLRCQSLRRPKRGIGERRRQLHLSGAGDTARLSGRTMCAAAFCAVALGARRSCPPELGTEVTPQRPDGERALGGPSSACPKFVPGSPHPLRLEGRVEPGPMGHSALAPSSTWGETRRGLRVSPASDRSSLHEAAAAAGARSVAVTCVTGH